jgi:hypothetical protein
MLSDEEFLLWCRRVRLSQEAQEATRRPPRRQNESDRQFTTVRVAALAMLLGARVVYTL